MRKIWDNITSEEFDELYYNQRLGLRKIGIIKGVSEYSIKKWAKNNDKGIRKKFEMSEKEYQTYLDNGLKNREIAKIKKTGIANIYKWRRIHGYLKFIPNIELGDMQYCARCKKIISKEWFSKDKSSASGYTYYCKDCVGEINKKYKQDNAIVCRYREYKYRAVSKKIKFNLTFDEFSILVNSPCFYTNIIDNPINGIDRLDNNKGYTFENCVPCCRIANIMKLDLSVDEFLNYINKIYFKFLE